MNRKIVLVIIGFLTVCSVAVALAPEPNYSQTVFDKIRITDQDVPDGFMYGQIPEFAKTVLLGNPWEMNRAAINKITKKLYPNGDANAVKSMHLSILTKKEHAYGYDIVCYIIIYNDGLTSRKEIDKLNEYNRYNSDRTILLSQGNIAVFLIVQDVANFKYIQNIKEKMEQRINAL